MVFGSTKGLEQPSTAITTKVLVRHFYREIMTLTDEAAAGWSEGVGKAGGGHGRGGREGRAATEGQGRGVQRRRGVGGRRR